MYIASLQNETVSIMAPDVTAHITYPHYWMAINAYAGVAECCTRFSKEPEFTPNLRPKIYVYGEMYTWDQYLKRLLLTAEKIGAEIHLRSVNPE